MALVAILMGLPTLRGGFVGGDDRQLVLNHVLVNHPSIEHALKLFTILHRDLYQPVPLLTFSLEFALADMLGLLNRGIDRAAWLFHLTNVLLHALNGVAVFYVLLIWQGILRRRTGVTETAPEQPGQPLEAIDKADGTSQAKTVATIGALLFVIHPLQAEVVAWLNGRMMLLSTLFATCSMLALASWLRRRRATSIIIGLSCVLLCGISKVRVGLPLVLFLLAACHEWYVVRRANLPSNVNRKRRIGALAFVGLSTLLMGVLAVVNIKATAQAGMFEGTATNFQGPRAARVLLSLGWYLEHFAWPSGLAAWYPSPLTVAWTDGSVLFALLLVIAFLVASLLWMRREPAAAAGAGIFLLTLASTLPIVPARSTLAADRYMYLPIIGLVWLVGCLAQWLYARARIFFGPRIAWGVPAAGAVLGVTLLTLSWTVGMTYETYLSKTQRLADLFPDTPHVWERVAWSHFSLGDYEKAIDVAQRELVHDDAELLGDVHGLIGLSQIELGRIDEGLDTLRKATRYLPERPLPHHRLAGALAKLGRCGEAVREWDEIVDRIPNFNPALVGLATCHKQLGQTKEARRRYGQAIGNNAYAVEALLGLSELDIQSADAEAYRRAEERLRALLSWMPENAVAWTNLGVILVRTNRAPEAVIAYRTALALDPANLPAALNLSRLHVAAGRGESAIGILQQAAELVRHVDEAKEVHEIGMDLGMPPFVQAMWESLEASSTPEHARECRRMRAWLHALEGKIGAAESLVEPLPDIENVPPDISFLSYATHTVILMQRLREPTGDNSEGDHRRLISCLATLSEDTPEARQTRQRMIRGLQVVDVRRPGNPWVYCVLARLLIADGKREAAVAALGLCRNGCTAPACHDEVRLLEQELQNDED